MSKKLLFIIAIFLFIVPFLLQAAGCSDNGRSVVFINGIFTDKTEAEQNSIKLKNYYEKENGKNDVKFLLSHNQSHLGGAGDVVKSVMQAYEGAYLDYDLTTMLRDIHSQLKTKKVLLVGHSQGTFYTNGAYDYLVKNGIPRESIAVYNLGTPADRVAGNGNYLTSGTDKLINHVVRGLIEIGFARRPLPANIEIKLSSEEEKKPLGGHSFSNAYLAGASGKIISQMQNALNNLSAKNEPSANDGCFNPPASDTSYYFKKAGFLIGDGAFNMLKKDKKLATTGYDFTKINYPSIISKIPEIFSNAYNWGKNLALNLRKYLSSYWFGASLASLPDKVEQIKEENKDFIEAADISQECQS
ncbi:MAG: hypothetical protein AAB877_00310, partial [Patescibacteria group bacterium]